MEYMARIIEPLKEVSDLDNLQALLVSNTTADKQAPWLQKWLLELIGTERTRREGGEFEGSYPMVEFMEWPIDQLASTALFTTGAVECSIVMGIPTVTKFTVELMKITTAAISSRAITAELALSQIG